MSGGKFEFDDGGAYIGEWENGLAEGHGVCTGPENVGKFEGFWRSGEEVSGIYYWPNGMTYKGQWKGGHRSGYGVEHSKTLTYLGEWVSGLKHGSGITQNKKTKRPCYEGTWRNGLHDGHGVEVYKDGGSNLASIIFLCCYFDFLISKLARYLSTRYTDVSVYETACLFWIFINLFR